MDEEAQSPRILLPLWKWEGWPGIRNLTGSVPGAKGRPAQSPTAWSPGLETNLQSSVPQSSLWGPLPGHWPLSHCLPGGPAGVCPLRKAEEQGCSGKHVRRIWGKEWGADRIEGGAQLARSPPFAPCLSWAQGGGSGKVAEAQGEQGCLSTLGAPGQARDSLLGAGQLPGAHSAAEKGPREEVQWEATQPTGCQGAPRRERSKPAVGRLCREQPPPHHHGMVLQPADIGPRATVAVMWAEGDFLPKVRGHVSRCQEHRATVFHLSSHLPPPHWSWGSLVPSRKEAGADGA